MSFTALMGLLDAMSPMNKKPPSTSSGSDSGSTESKAATAVHPLATAIEKGDADAVRDLLGEHRELLFTSLSDPASDSDSDEDDAKYTPLQLACAKGRTAVARVMLDVAREMKVDITGEYNKRMLPLQMALGAHHFETADLLLEYGAKVDQPCGGKHKLTPGHFFAHKDTFVALGYLLRHGLSPDAVDGDGDSLLMAACASKLFPMGAISLLLEAKANVNYQNDKGNTALLCALVVDNREAVALLILQGGADPDVGMVRNFLAEPGNKKMDDLVKRLVAYRGRGSTNQHGADSSRNESVSSARAGVATVAV